MLTRKLGLALLLLVGMALSTALNSRVSAAEPTWESLLPDIDASRGALAGEWRKTGNGLTVSAATSGRLVLPVTPLGEYDLRASFTRRTGKASIGFVVVQGGRQVAFELDAWGQHLAGFQNINGRSIQQNPTRRENVALENNRRYTMTVEVRRDSIRGLLDGREIANYRTTGTDLALSDFWTMPDSRAMALLAWESETTFHTVDLRMVSGSSIPLARANPVPGGAPPTRPAVAPITRPAPNPARTVSARGGKRVLMVIANYHFFFREYGDPRSEFERAGFRVTVAAGRRGACNAHQNSGESPGQGTVQADLSLSDVRANDYDAVLFSGGWGASAYQYAFTGRYNDPQYNGDPATKAQVNRIINEFVAQDKYVAALCNGVSVLAWARVNGRSPLQGKRVCAPVRQAAAGIYNGRQAQPPCRWHPETNGAILSPAGALGDRNTAADDVMVDGKILTGEDDISAREMGRRLVAVLSQ
jgi:putative intracellular protease/amidase